MVPTGMLMSPTRMVDSPPPRLNPTSPPRTLEVPPTTEPVDHETEHYAHDVSKHVRGYLMVGGTLLFFTALTVFLSYVNFGSQKANVAVELVVNRNGTEHKLMVTPVP